MDYDSSPRMIQGRTFALDSRLVDAARRIADAARTDERYPHEDQDGAIVADRTGELMSLVADIAYTAYQQGIADGSGGTYATPPTRAVRYPLLTELDMELLLYAEDRPQ